MPAPKNLFRKRLTGNRTIFGSWVGLPDATASEIAAGAGFDWLLIDAEHVPLSVDRVMTLLRAIAPYDVAPVVRPVSGDPNLIKQLLDVGAQTLLVPMVETAEQARDLVRATRYPPQGLRGVGTSLARAAQWGATGDYLQTANDEICLLLQVETMKGLKNLQQIVDTIGVDGVFIGPSDLSASMGHIGEPGHPDVVAAVEQAIATVTKSGKLPGVLCTNGPIIKRYVEAGAQFVAICVDTMVLSQGLRSALQVVKPLSEMDLTSHSGGY